MDAPTRSLRPSQGQRALADALARGEAAMGKAIEAVPASVYIDPDRYEAEQQRAVPQAAAADRPLGADPVRRTWRSPMTVTARR